MRPSLYQVQVEVISVFTSVSSPIGKKTSLPKSTAHAWTAHRHSSLWTMHTVTQHINKLVNCSWWNGHPGMKRVGLHASAMLYMHYKLRKSLSNFSVLLKEKSKGTSNTWKWRWVGWGEECWQRGGRCRWRGLSSRPSSHQGSVGSQNHWHWSCRKQWWYLVDTDNTFIHAKTILASGRWQF